MENIWKIYRTYGTYLEKSMGTIWELFEKNIWEIFGKIYGVSII